MENNTVKKDNRKALPKYLLILFVAAIFGGVLGFAAGWAMTTSRRSSPRLLPMA